MWKRVHLATLDGPDPGHVIDLGAAGRALPPGPGVTVGRGDLADHQLLDPHLSRLHFTAGAGLSRWGRAGAWIEGPGRRRHRGVGARFRAGNTTFEVRTDAPPRRGGRRDLTRVLPLAASLGFVSMWVFPGAGPWPLVAAALLTPAGMWLAARVGGPPLPDPAELRRTRGAPADGGAAGAVASAAGAESSREESWRVDLGRTGRRRCPRRPRRLAVTAGDVLGLAGAGAPGLARWVAAQLIAAGAAASRTQEPGTCRYTLTFPGERVVTILAATNPAFLPGHATTALPVPAGHDRDVTEHWYDVFRSRAGRVELPEVVHLAEYLPDLAALPAVWERPGPHLAAPVGVRAGAGALVPVEVDLAGDSPHAVVAGTTGAGKSELLTSWLCALATRYPPAHVAMVLIDYKGGATFGPLTRLPHVLDVLTDLDHAATVRALESLRVEIHRREVLLKDSGAAGLAEHNARAEAPLARLLIAVDEFRVLADEYPDVLDQLVRVAAQGRSLGIHVILATQRPGGTMTPDIRANMGLRACLRVVEETDSIDLLGRPDAAHLPSLPGRMILRGEEVHTVQTLWAGQGAASIVRACAGAARAAPHLAVTHRPWAPPLPDHLPAPPATDPGHIALGVSDLPAEQRLGTWQVPLGANLLISGEAGSGRTAAARVVAHGAASCGRGVHVIAQAALAPAGAGTFSPIDDPAACYTLLERIARRGGPDALVIDGAEHLAGTLDDALGPGEGLTFLQETLRACRHHGRFTAVTTALPAPTWARASERIVFPPAEAHQRALAGLSKRFEGAGPPGRAVAIRGGQETLIQVARHPGESDDHSGAAGPPVPEFFLRPLPTHVDLPLTQLPLTPGAGICIGIGGEDHGQVHLPCPAGGATLVLAPPGAGKSRLLRVVAARAEAVGRGAEVEVVDDLHTLDPADLDRLHEALRGGRHLVVATTPDGLASGYHPLLGRLRSAEHTVYIGRMGRAAVGVDLGRYITPHVPGRAVVHSRGHFTPVQLDVCSQA